MPTAQRVEFGVKSTEAIANLKSKINLPTKHWDKYLGGIHARGFTVAGATKLALLDDIHRAVDIALENGETITAFRKRFDEIVHKHGWKYKGKRGWRTSLIYNTNKKTARAAGKWAQIERVKKRRPFLKYTVVDDNRLRALHLEWKDTVLAVDDPWWNTHYPPNGWGCRCSVRQLSQRDMDREELSVSNRPKLELNDIVNAKTGEVYKDVPKGIDVGWNYNTGKAWLGADKALGQQIMKLPKAIRDDVLKDAAPRFAKENGASWKEWLKVVKTASNTEGLAHSVGLITPKLSSSLESKGIEIKSALIIADKIEDIALVDDAIYKILPKHISNYDLAVWDNANNTMLILKQSKEKNIYNAVVLDWLESTGEGRVVSTKQIAKVDIINSKNHQILDEK